MYIWCNIIYVYISLYIIYNMVSDCLQQNWRMIQRWIRWSLGGHQWFVVSTAALRSVQDEGAQRAHHDEVSGREGGRCHAMSPGCEVKDGLQVAIHGSSSPIHMVNRFWSMLNMVCLEWLSLNIGPGFIFWYPIFFYQFILNWDQGQLYLQRGCHRVTE